MSYDHNNIFARILRGEAPCRSVYEDAFALAFHDLAPQAPVHILVIPKGAYVSMADFASNGSEAEVTGFIRAVGAVAAAADLNAGGYRIIANHGPDSHQDVPHLHVHVLGGGPLGRVLVRSDCAPSPRRPRVKRPAVAAPTRTAN